MLLPRHQCGADVVGGRPTGPPPCTCTAASRSPATSLAWRSSSPAWPRHATGGLGQAAACRHTRPADILVGVGRKTHR